VQIPISLNKINQVADKAIDKIEGYAKKLWK
jgi:hypothetical protein